MGWLSRPSARPDAHQLGMSFQRSSNALRWLLAAVVSAGLFTGTAQAGPVFNAFSDFQTGSNTASNTWSYWSTGDTNVANYAANIALMPAPFTGSCGFGTSCWFAGAPDNGVVLQNNTGGPVSFQSETVPNGILALYPRESIALVRFLVPTSGNYQLNGFFEALSNPQEPTLWAVVVDGNFGAALLDSPGHNTFGEHLAFSFSVPLNANDTVDFFAFRPGGAFNFDNFGATGFDVTITSGAVVGGVPEPATLWLVGSGLAALSGIAWRRRRR